MARTRVPLQACVDPGGRLSHARDRGSEPVCTARRPRPWRPSDGEGSREIAGLLAHHWLGAADEDKAALATSRWRVTVRVRSTRSTRRSPTTGSCCPCWSVAVRSRRSRSGCSSWRSPCTWRCGSRRPRDLPAGLRALDPAGAGRGERHACGSPAASCPTTRTRVRRSPGRTSNCACSCSTGSSSSGRSARSCRPSRNAGTSPPTASATCSIFGKGCAGPTARRSPPVTSSSASSGC